MTKPINWARALRGAYGMSYFASKDLHSVKTKSAKHDKICPITAKLVK